VTTRTTPPAVVGIPRNTRSTTLADRLTEKASQLGLAHRVIDLATLSYRDGAAVDAHGQVSVTHLAPGTTYGEPAAHEALAFLTATDVAALNPLEACAVADDKIRTCTYAAAKGLPQPSWCSLRPSGQAGLVAQLRDVGFPLVLKRPHGALGMWNRLCSSPAELAAAADELLCEGAVELLAQTCVVESRGRSLRVVVLDDEVLAATELVAAPGEWRSNGALGAVGHDVELSAAEHALAVAALEAVGLGYAGVDLLRSVDGPLLIEVNAASSFNGAERRTGRDIAAAVLAATLAR
jgi:ribosomal protein S6--L-glutamate ligase